MSDPASADDGENWEDEDDEESEQGKLSEDDKPGCVMDTLSNMVHKCMKRFCQKQVKHDELTQPGWKDAADYFCERYRQYGTFEWGVLADVAPQVNDETVAPAPTTFWELRECLDIVPGILQCHKGLLDQEVAILHFVR
jgi:hypothetical protein